MVRSLSIRRLRIIYIFQYIYPEGDTENTTITYDVELQLLEGTKESEALLKICSLSYEFVEEEEEGAWVANYEGVSLKLRSDQQKTGLSAPENISYTNIFQRQLINSEGANTVSPTTNLSLSGLLLKVEWDALLNNRGIYGYEVKLTPCRGDEPVVNFSETKIVPAQRSETSHSIHMEVCEGVYYRLEVRAIGTGFSPGDWSNPILLLAGSSGEIPDVPDLSITEEAPPSVLNIMTSIPNPPSTPYFIQIFKNAEVIYEGAPGLHSHMLAPTDTNVEIKTRVVAGGGVCSGFATFSETFTAVIFDGALATEVGMLAIPIDLISTHEDHFYSENTLTCEATVPSGGDDIKVEIGDYEKELVSIQEGVVITAVISNSSKPLIVPNGAYTITKITENDNEWSVFFEGQGISAAGSGTCDLEIYSPVGVLNEPISIFSIPGDIKITRMSFVSRACSIIDGAVENLSLQIDTENRESPYSLTLSGNRPGLYVGSSNPYNTDDCMHIYQRGNIEDPCVLTDSATCRIVADYYGGTLNVNGTLLLYYEKVSE